MKPFFSIIVPVYNVAPYLRECLDSVLAQTCTDWECLCVNDGSTDESGAILDEYAQKDSRFRVFHKPNGGVSSARNLALNNAKGEWIGFLDGDDVWAEAWLQNFEYIINLYPQVDLVRFRFNTTRQMLCEGVGDYKIFKGEDAQTWGWRTFTKGGWSWLNIIKRDLIMIRYPQKMWFMEDNLFMLSVAQQIRFAIQAECDGYYYRVREGSACSKKRSFDQIQFLFDGVISLMKDETFRCSREVMGMFYTVVMDWVHFGNLKDVKVGQKLRQIYEVLNRKGGCSINEIEMPWRIGFWILVKTSSFYGIKFLLTLQRIKGLCFKRRLSRL